MISVVDTRTTKYGITFDMEVWDGRTWRETHYWLDPLFPEVVVYNSEGGPEEVWMHDYNVVHLPWYWLSTIPPHLAAEKPCGCTIVPKYSPKDWAECWRLHHETQRLLRGGWCDLPKAPIRHSFVRDTHLFTTAVRRWN